MAGDELEAAWRLVADAIAQRRLYGACPACNATLPGPDARYCSRACRAEHRRGSAKAAGNGRFVAPLCRGCGRTASATWDGECGECRDKALSAGDGHTFDRDDLLSVMSWLVTKRTSPPLSDRRTTW